MDFISYVYVNDWCMCKYVYTPIVSLFISIKSMLLTDSSTKVNLPLGLKNGITSPKRA